MSIYSSRTGITEIDKLNNGGISILLSTFEDWCSFSASEDFTRQEALEIYHKLGEYLKNNKTENENWSDNIARI